MLTTLSGTFIKSEVGRTQVSVEPRTDHALLKATRDGDEDAFGELVGRYRNSLTNYVYRILNDYDEAVEIAQETFVRVYFAAERYNSDYAFSTYLYRIATNLAISEIRRRKRRKLFSITGYLSGDDGEPEKDFDIADERPLPENSLASRETQAVVRKAISALPEKYRVPIVLRDIEGKSYEEIARILEANEGTIKSRISRARDMLRGKLENFYKS